MSEREELIFKAKLAEQAERYDEMTEFMKKSVSLNTASPLTTEERLEERNLLSVAFKNAVGTRRAALRIVNAVEARQRGKGNQMQVAVSREYQDRISAELNGICEDVITLLTDELKKDNVNDVADTRVFYEKMMGDYYRYICEFSNNPKKLEATEKARAAYQRADVASKSLPVTNPVRLGLALNFSVFYYEIMSNPAEACRMAQEAFDLAIAELDHTAEDSQRDSTLIMQLLRDNLTLWMTNDEAQRASNGEPAIGGETNVEGGVVAGGVAAHE